VGMMCALVGAAGFRRGTDLYFQRHDGQAVTTEDFVVAMEDANGIDLAQFRRWYSQAGTPVLRVETRWRAGSLVVDIEQSCPATPKQPLKEPFHIPVLLGLVGQNGEELVNDALEVESDTAWERRGSSLLIHLRHRSTRLRCGGLARASAVSFLRGFSAPVRVDYPRAAATLAFLASHDSDGFARWDALQTLLLGELAAIQSGAQVSQRVLDVFHRLLRQALRVEGAERKALLNRMLTLPSEEYLIEQAKAVDIEAICGARDKLRQAVAAAHQEAWLRLYKENASPGPYAPDAAGMARRGVRNLALGYLAECMGDQSHELIENHLDAADNLTDRLAALHWLADSQTHPERTQRLATFYERWQHESLVINQWLVVQATSRRTDVAAIEALERHPAFDVRNPNKLHSLYGAFSLRNSRNFHAADGTGYAFLAQRIIQLDAQNPQVAARFSKALAGWRKFDAGRQAHIKSALGRILAVADEPQGLSKDVYEVVEKSLRAEEAL